MNTPESDRVFSSTVSLVYDELLVPMIFEPYATDLATRLNALQVGALLEVAAGTGVVTRALARSLPVDSEIIATDLNQAMLDRASATETERPVRWEQADVMSLPFGDETFDVVVCQFGVMFFQPRAEAFAEIRRVLRPGGKFIFNVWDGLADNEFAEVVASTIADEFPDDPPRFIERTPHGYHDPALIRNDLVAGGFGTDPTVEQVEHRSYAKTAHEAATAYCTGTPIRDELEQRRPGGLAAITALVATALEDRFGAVALDGRISAKIVTVTK